MRYTTRRRRPVWRWLIGLLITSSLLVGAGLLWMYLTRPIVPQQIRNQLTFSPLAYVGGGGYKASSYKYDSKEKILSYILTSNDGNKVTVTEQSQPPQFAEIPEYKDKFLDSVMKRYSSVQSLNGVVYLTRPPKQKKQVAVIIDKGLLVFMSADKDLSEDQWRQVADRLQVERL